MSSKISNVRWRVVTLLMFSFMIWYMDRTNISIAGPVMMKYFHWNPWQFGLVMTAFFVGYAFTQIPGGWLGRPIWRQQSHMDWNPLGCLFFVLPTPFGATLRATIFIRGLMGIGEGVNAPAHTSLIAQWLPKRETGMAQGLSSAGPLELLSPCRSQSGL